MEAQMNEREAAYNAPSDTERPGVGYVVPPRNQGDSGFVGPRYLGPRNPIGFHRQTVATDRWTGTMWTTDYDSTGQDGIEVSRVKHHWRTSPVTTMWLVSVAVICASMGILQATGAM